MERTTPPGAPVPDTEERWTRSDALNAIRNVARQHDYAVGVHGSQTRDLDLIVAPWTAEATPDPAEVIDSIVAALPVVHAGPEERPHGRVGWALRFVSGISQGIDAWYIDVSVFKPASPDTNSS